jgi:hypothetical protein
LLFGYENEEAGLIKGRLSEIRHYGWDLEDYDVKLRQAESCFCFTRVMLQSK